LFWALSPEPCFAGVPGADFLNFPLTKFNELNDTNPTEEGVDVPDPGETVALIPGPAPVPVLGFIAGEIGAVIGFLGGEASDGEMVILGVLPCRGFKSSPPDPETSRVSPVPAIGLFRLGDGSPVGLIGGGG
jgi:hypothetical protein